MSQITRFDRKFNSYKSEPCVPCIVNKDGTIRIKTATEEQVFDFHHTYSFTSGPSMSIENIGIRTRISSFINFYTMSAIVIVTIKKDNTEDFLIGHHILEGELQLHSSDLPYQLATGHYNLPHYHPELTRIIKDATIKAKENWIVESMLLGGS